jgi:hypothetical protein
MRDPVDRIVNGNVDDGHGPRLLDRRERWHNDELACDVVPLHDRIADLAAGGRGTHHAHGDRGRNGGASNPSLSLHGDER